MRSHVSFVKGKDYSNDGNQSAHLVLFFEGIRSERLLMPLVADKLSVRWYVGYNLDEPRPDHSSLTRIRECYGVEAIRRFFEVIVKHGQAAGLVWGNASVDSLNFILLTVFEVPNCYGDSTCMPSLPRSPWKIVQAARK